MPFNPLATVQLLADDEDKCEFFQPVISELQSRGMDTEDLREIICSELGECHCFKQEKTRRHYPETVSDYYSIWIDTCNEKMFLKLLVVYDEYSFPKLLVITSFKRDDHKDV